MAPIAAAKAVASSNSSGLPSTNGAAAASTTIASTPQRLPGVLSRAASDS
jgi:hypothetical protein